MQHSNNWFTDYLGRGLVEKKKRMSVLIGHALGQNMNRTLNPQQRNCAFLATPDGHLIVVAYALKPTNTDKRIK